jgi:hypothetical protein
MAIIRGKTFEGEGGLLGGVSPDEHQAQLEAAAAASRARRLALATAAPTAEVEDERARAAKLLAEMREAEARAFSS